MLKPFVCLMLALLLLAGTASAEGGGPFSFATKPPAEAQTSPVSTDDIIAGVKAALRGADIFGGALIVTQNGRELLNVTYGLRDHRGAPVTPDTRFRVASVTKLVSAIGLMMLYDEGKLDLDAPLGSVLPFPVINPAFPAEPVTARQILTHTSSIVSNTKYHPRWESLPKGNQYFEDSLRPGYQCRYANMNGGLIGSVIEALSGQSINTFMQQRLFAPLGIDAAYNAGLLTEQSDISEMIKANGERHAGVKKQINSLRDYNNKCDPRENTDKTVGGLYISATGLSRIAQMLANGGVYDGIRYLNEDTVRLMAADQQTIPGTSVHCDSPYGLATVRVTDVGEHPWYGHQGRYLGLVANLYYQPATGLTFAFIATGYDGDSVNNLSNLSRKLMDMSEEMIRH